MTGRDDRQPVTLDDCDREPIHIPGTIQPHGVLLVLDPSNRLVRESANARAVLADQALPPPGDVVTSAHLDGLLARPEIQGIGRDDRIGVGAELRGEGGAMDALVHRSDGSLVVEIEPRPPEAPAATALAARIHDISLTLAGVDTTAELLQAAVDAVRDVSGFDRAMAYQFREDKSGEVVAESRRPDLEPFLGLRYPAADIPAQARRLYAINPLRIIADVAYEPVPLVPDDTVPATGRPLDMSHAMLRSVSPIHVEYLTNMGVGASMSISILQDGELWGMIACHHTQPYRPSYAVRMGCLTLSTMLSLHINRTTELEKKAMWRRSSKAREAIARRAAGADDMLHGIIHGTPSLLEIVPCVGAAATLRGRLVSVGVVPSREDMRRIIEWLCERRKGAVFATHELGALDATFADMSSLPGVLAVEFHPECDGYVLWFREEQVRTVRWGGNPEKPSTSGPQGPRLTPRGSFEEWREIAAGSAEPWQPGELEAAKSLRRQLQEIALRSSAHAEEMQSMLIGMLGHDLRNPLNAIASSAAILGEDEGDLDVGRRIRRSTTRMSTLITSMLDYATVRRGGQLPIETSMQDILPIVCAIAEESMAAFPGTKVQVSGEGPFEAPVDRARLEQVLSNLFSNARHHGDASKPVEVRLRTSPRGVVVEVFNHGEPVPLEERDRIFDPFHTRARTGGGGRVGLGLFICREIATAHGGSIRMECEAAGTTFVLELPRAS